MAGLSISSGLVRRNIEGWKDPFTSPLRTMAMRFMMLVIPKAYETATADFVPPADLVARMAKYNDSLAKAGVLLGLDGLAPPGSSTVTAARLV